jgi:hypothetical protein
MLASDKWDVCIADGALAKIPKHELLVQGTQKIIFYKLRQ